MKINFGRILIIGCMANFMQAIYGWGVCQFCNCCIWGCLYGVYFSSNVVILLVVEVIGNMMLCLNLVVYFIIYDLEMQKVKGVWVFDVEIGEVMEFYVKIVFFCVFVLGFMFILMNFVDEYNFNGLGNSFGQFGYNLMDYYFRVGVQGIYDDYGDWYDEGWWLIGFYIFCFCNFDKCIECKDYIWGFGYQGGGSC